jgi:hypothetical protein
MGYVYLKTADDSLKDVLVNAVIQAKKRFWCVAPFVTKDGLSLIIDNMKPRIDYRLITRLDTGDMFFGSLDLDIIIKFIQNNSNKGKVGIRQRFVRKRDFRFRAIISIQVLALLAEEYDQAEACNSRNG